MKHVKSQNGNTLILVLGFIMIMALLTLPLLTSSNNGQLQAATDGHSEAAFDKAESAAVIYKRLFTEASAFEASQATPAFLTSEDAASLAADLHALQLFGDNSLKVSVTASAAGDPQTIEFSATSGELNQKRGKTVQLSFQKETVETTNPEMDDRNAFYRKHGVVKSTAAYSTDYMFRLMGSKKPSAAFISNTYNKHNYTVEFNKYMAAYIGDAFDNRFRAKPPGTTASNKPPTDNRTDTTTYNRNGGVGTLTAANVKMTEVWANPLIITKPSGSSVTAIQATGNVVLEGSVTNTLIDGNLIVGKDLTIESGNTNLVVNGNVIVGSNARLGGYSGSITIKGDLIVHGDLIFNGSVNEINVTGNIVVNGRFDFEQNLNRFIVAGSVSCASFKTGTVANGTINGSLVATSGNILFGNTVNDWLIKGSVSAGGSITFNTIRNLVIQGSIYAGNSIYFANAIDNSFKVGGSLLSDGKITFGNTINGTSFAGDIISGSSTITFENVVFDLSVAGSLAAKGNINFGNDVQKLNIGKDLISAGSISTKTFGHSSGYVTVVGMMAALSDISLGNTLYDVMKFGGFYTGGSLVLKEAPTKDWKPASQYLKIYYNPPNPLAGPPIFTEIITFDTKWSTKSYNVQP